MLSMRRMSKYTSWSKDALISKIISLEHGKACSAQELDRDSSLELSAVQLPVSHSPAKTVKNAKKMDFAKFSTRRVAIRFAYLGWRYHGLAFQKAGHKTVEGEIIAAFYKTKCIPSNDPAQCNFSRCGRTDADVSAMAQVISLDLRSVVPKDCQTDPDYDKKELDYLKILNSHLPADILAYQICLRPPAEFDARFSCTGRHYHYYFSGAYLDLDAMQEAANLLVGEHDFRNFCKIDGSKQITNFRRRITSAEILKQDVEGGLHYLSLKGKAFLWNQVRSIMAVLLLIGQGLEQPSIIGTLLDTKATPQRPAYEIAWGVPLVLHNCEFPPLDWLTSGYTSLEPLHNVWHEMLQKQAIALSMLDSVRPFASSLTPSDLGSRINVGQGIGRRSARYTPLLNRPLSESPETVNRKWLERKASNDRRDSESQ